MAGTTVRDGGNTGYSGGGFVAINMRQAILNACGDAWLTQMGEGIKNPLDIDIRLINKYMGQSKPDTVINVLKEEFVPRVVAEFNDSMIKYYTMCAESVPGVEELFKTLRQRNKLIALNTGFSRGIANAIIKKLKWSNLVDYSVTSDEVEAGRPYPFMIHNICSKLNISPVDVIKVGDTISDIEEGISAGVYKTIGVASGNNTADELSAAGADLVISDIRDLLGID